MRGRLSASVLVSIPALAERHTLLISAVVSKTACVTLFISSLLQMQANPSARHTQASCMACAYGVGLLLMSRRRQQYRLSESSHTLQADYAFTAVVLHHTKFLN